MSDPRENFKYLNIHFSSACLNKGRIANQMKKSKPFFFCFCLPVLYTYVQPINKLLFLCQKTWSKKNQFFFSKDVHLTLIFFFYNHAKLFLF